MEQSNSHPEPASTETFEHKFPPLPPPQNVPGCLVYDSAANDYKTINPYTQTHKKIPDEFIDMSFINDLTPISLTEDDGVIKYIPANKPAPPQETPSQENVDDPKKAKEASDLPPEPLARVRIRFEGRNEKGELLEKQRDRNQLKAFKLHNDTMIPGIHYGTASMRVGETAWFKFLPQYHYGPQGCPPFVPENATLYYKIELVDYTNQKKQLANDDYEGRVQYLEEAREKGNEAFSKQEYVKALKEYRRGTEIFNNVPKVLQAAMTEEQNNVFKEFQVKLSNNAALACLKTKEYRDGLKFANAVLKIEPGNSKALFRKGECLMKLKEWDQAVKVLYECASVDKGIKEQCGKMIEECKRMKEGSRIGEKKIYQKILEKLSEQEQKEEAERKLKEKIERKKAREEAEMGKDEVKPAEEINKVGIKSLLEGTVINTAVEQRVRVDITS